MSRFMPTDRKTLYLFPPSMDDWLKEDHLAQFVVEVVDQLGLSNLISWYAGRGSAAHHPAALLALLVYGYATGVFPSRCLERATNQRDICPEKRRGMDASPKAASMCHGRTQS